MVVTLVSGAGRNLAHSKQGHGMTLANATFSMNDWDEQSDAEINGLPRITRVFSTNTYRGDISGSSSVNYVIAYPTGDTGTFRGYEQIVGRLGDAEGSFILEHVGSWEKSTVTTSWTVVEGTGTGALEGLSGRGGYVAHHDVPETPVTLDYSLPGR
jgi:hypothetical protein